MKSTPPANDHTWLTILLFVVLKPFYLFLSSTEEEGLLWLWERQHGDGKEHSGPSSRRPGSADTDYMVLARLLNCPKVRCRALNPVPTSPPRAVVSIKCQEAGGSLHM